MTTVEKFTATAMYPSCHRVDCHPIREPKSAPSPAEIAAWEEDHEEIVIRSFAGDRHTLMNPPRPVDESGYAVVRICDCGHEWGQM